MNAYLIRYILNIKKISKYTDRVEVFKTGFLIAMYIIQFERSNL